MKRAKTINRIRRRRQSRARVRVAGTAKRPRLSVFRSNRNLSVQLIDDDSGKTLLSGSLSDVDKKAKVEKEMTAGRAKAYLLGQAIAKKALEAKIKEVVFDRGHYKYHGKIKAFADGAREAGLKI